MVRIHDRLIPLTLALSVACSDNPGNQPTPEPGQTRFISADARAGQQTQNRAPAAQDGELADTTDDDTRTVEEGDIYRVSEARGLIFNLNSYRGLQIIDVNDPTKPIILGRVRLSGTPVEMYQVGDRLFMLLNNWWGYWGSRTDVRTDGFNGGLVVVADVSNPRAPRITGTARVPGYIRTSRLTRGVGGEALYVVASDYNYTAKTYVRSFDVSSQGQLELRSDIDLGGWVTDIQASPDRLMVADFDWNRNSGKSSVTIIDISDPHGVMRQGATVQIEGYVEKKTNLSMHGDIMRVVSGSNWSGTTTNHLETFDTRDLDNPVRVDHATFGDNETLFATLFLDDKAFCVTYLRVDPFHAFRIDEAGLITPVSEYTVSGWNDFFKPVSGGRRLVGVGRNDENSTFKLAVSLYDISDLALADPMIAREDIDLSWAWSEANWDDRAFSVLEDATSIATEDGTIETGLVLLPFSGWDDANQRYVSAVQIFTFSDKTLTKRGLMDHGSQVRRSFLANSNDATTANLGDAELSLFDTKDPNDPNKLGALELAPNYTDLMLFGPYAVRRRGVDYYYSWWGDHSNSFPNDSIEVVSRSGDVDLAAPIASIEIPSGAQVTKIGERVAVVSTVLKTPGDDKNEPVFSTTIDLWNFADPTAPKKLGSLTTDELPNQSWWGYGYGVPIIDCFDYCGGWWGSGGSQLQTTDGAMIFVKPIQERELEGMLHTRSIYPQSQYWTQSCWNSTDGSAQECTYYSGGIYCSQLTRTDGTVEPETCSGSIVRCEQNEAGETTCEEIDSNSISTDESEYDHESYRYWTHYDLHLVDIRSGQPALAGVIEMEKREQAVGMLTKGSDLYLNFTLPHRVAGDGRSYVRYFFRKIGLQDPTEPALLDDVNVPGELIAVDGNTLITKDLLWGDKVVETSLDRLTLRGDEARLDAVRRFEDQYVEAVKLDGRGHALVTTNVPWLLWYRSGRGQEETKLTILDTTEASFPIRSELPIDDWAQLASAAEGRALFTVPGGILVVNVDDASAPYAQAFFSVVGWTNDIEFDNGRIYLSTGRFGIYEMNADTFNLLTEEK
jgi:hypothetical protein